MKLLLGENLSRRLVPFLQNEFRGSTQVALIGFEQADDGATWRHAKENGHVIVARDADFEELSAVHGGTAASNLDKNTQPDKSSGAEITTQASSGSPRGIAGEWHRLYRTRSAGS